MAAQTVHTEQHGRVLTVRLDNPPRNFMNGRMVAELGSLVRRLQGDRSIGAVVITGAPDDVFITHYDVGEIAGAAGALSATFSPGQAAGGLRAVGAARRVPGVRGAIGRTPAAGVIALLEIHELFLRLEQARQGGDRGDQRRRGRRRLRAGAGVRPALHGGRQRPDRPAGDRARIIPGGGGTQRLTRALGPARALELMLEGTLLSPAEAREAGLVHRTIAPAQLLRRRSPPPSAWRAARRRRSRRSSGRSTRAALARSPPGCTTSAPGSWPPPRHRRRGWRWTATPQDVERSGAPAIADPDAYRPGGRARSST